MSSGFFEPGKRKHVDRSMQLRQPVRQSLATAEATADKKGIGKGRTLASGVVLLGGGLAELRELQGLLSGELGGDVLPQYRLIDLFSVDAQLTRRGDANPDVVLADVNDHYFDGVADDNALISLSG